MKLESGRRNSVMVLKIRYDVMNDDELSWVLTKVLVGRYSNSKWSSLVYRCWGLEPWGAFASSIAMGHVSNWSKVGEQEKERKQKDCNYEMVGEGSYMSVQIRYWFLVGKGKKRSSLEEGKWRLRGTRGSPEIQDGKQWFVIHWSLGKDWTEDPEKCSSPKQMLSWGDPEENFTHYSKSSPFLSFSVLLLISPDMGERDQVKGGGSRRARGG